MKCDDFLPLLATGGWFGRWRARRHASHCARCAAASSLLRDLTPETTMTPVPVHLRRIWLSAASAEGRSSAASPARPTARPQLLRIVAAPCAIACLILLSLAVARWPAKPVVPQAPNHAVAAGGQPSAKARLPMSDAGAITVVEIDAAQQLAWLDERVIQLASDVENLAKASRKREVERQIGELLALHPDW